MAKITTLANAIEENIHDGDSVAMEGFTHLIPHAAAHEIIRQGRKYLTLIRMTPDLIYDQLIGMGCAQKLVFSWGGNPGVGSLHRMRDAIENQWPCPLQLNEHSHAAMANAYAAGASRLPFAVLRGYLGTDHEQVNPDQIKRVTCPFTGEVLAAVPAIRPDVAVIHAQRADKNGNVHLSGIVGVQKEAVFAAKRVIVTVEEIIEDMFPYMGEPNILPCFTVNAVVLVPNGAHPSFAQGFSTRDNAFYKDWDQISADRERFRSWMQKYVLEAKDFAATWALMKEDGLV